MKKAFTTTFVVGLFFLSSVCGSIRFRSNSSSLSVDNGATLDLDKKIPDCRGKVVKKNGAQIAGSEIVFNKGLFEDSDGLFAVVGTLKADQSSQIVLDGNKTFRGFSGTVLQSLIIKNSDNRIEGDVLVKSDIDLYDASTSLTCAVIRRLPATINLHNGTLFLEENLGFVDGKKIVGPGVVICNGRTISFGATLLEFSEPLYFDRGNDVSLDGRLSLSSTWTFSGSDNTIIGNGNVLEFKPNGSIVVERGSKLTLKGLALQGVAGDCIRCLDDAASIEFDDVVMSLSNDFLFDKGAFRVSGWFDLLGSSKFAYTSPMQSAVCHGGVLNLDAKVTFSYDSISGLKDRLMFENNGALLRMRDATLYVTTTGMKLTGGRLLVKGAPRFCVEAKDDLMVSVGVNGIEIGDNSAGNDMICEVSPASVFTFEKGHVYYRNVLDSSLKMQDPLSTFYLAGDTTLHLDQTLDVGKGRMLLAHDVSLLKQAGKNIIGSIEVFHSQN